MPRAVESRVLRRLSNVNKLPDPSTDFSRFMFACVSAFHIDELSTRLLAVKTLPWDTGVHAARHRRDDVDHATMYRSQVASSTIRAPVPVPSSHLALVVRQSEGGTAPLTTRQSTQPLNGSESPGGGRSAAQFSTDPSHSRRTHGRVGSSYSISLEQRHETKHDCLLISIAQ